MPLKHILTYAMAIFFYLPISYQNGNDSGCWEDSLILFWIKLDFKCTENVSLCQLESMCWKRVVFIRLL